MSALILSATVIETTQPGVFDIAVTEAAYKERRRRSAKKWGLGAAIVIRIEPEEEAATHGDHKHLHGHLLAPTSEWTGYTVTELKADMKARFLPDGMKSTTEMNHEQFVEFNRSVEQCIREEYPSECWDACAASMALSDSRNG